MNHRYYEQLAKEAMHLQGPTEMRRWWKLIREVLPTYHAPDRREYFAMLRRVVRYANADWQQVGPGRWVRL